MRNLDHEAVLRARVLLLASGELDPWRALGAYRVLAEVSPRAYAPRLAEALLGHRRRTDVPEHRLALAEEAATAARRCAGDSPRGARALRAALGAYEHELFAAGRREEGRAVCAELAETGAYGRLATVLAEDGRHAEAAELHELRLGGAAAAGPGAPGASEVSEVSDWTLIGWAAELDAAGRTERALEVFGRLVDGKRRRAAADRAPLAVLVWLLHHYAGMLADADRPAEAATARREASDALDRLAAGGEPVSWSDIRATWVTLFALSGRRDEPAATPGAPVPALGTYAGHGWSPDVRAAWSASVPELERAAAAAGGPPEAVVVQRRLTVRRAMRWEFCGPRDGAALLPSYDEGIALARALPDDGGAATRATAARALADRAMFLLALKRYGEARRDFAEAAGLSGGPVSPISHPTSPK
ncbi:hypothetical protein [Streptomyces sp. NPDC048659]|uniref:hypothetical protein n=1 Tax=Streptomyces sp. NPDC048659 TaxID=3155489 RepID=UPI00343973E2